MINKLLILCARLHPEPQALSEIQRLLEYPLDWDQLIKISAKERVGPLLYHSLKSFEKNIPASKMGLLRETYYGTLAQNIHHHKKLIPLYQTIVASQLRVALTKGAQLSETVYHNTGLRQYDDIDLIVHSSDWPQLEKILLELGFSSNSNTKLFKIQKTRNLDWTTGPTFIKDKMNVEIHFHLPGFHLPLNQNNDLWNSLQSINIADVAVPVLPLEYELCFLCLHAQQHSYSRLIWLTDIAELSINENLNWNKVISICKTEKIHASVFYGLYLVNTLWPLTVSDEILKKFPITSLEKKILQFLWPEEKIVSRDLSISIPWFASTFLSLLARKDIILLMKNLARFYFPPQLWVSHFYNIPQNSLKIYLHYLWRLYRPLLVISRQLLRIG